MTSRKQLYNIEKELQTHLQEILQHDSTIMIIYLFGSFAQGNEKKHSDLDLAFLIREDIYKGDVFEAIRPVHMIAAQIGREFDRETDTIILNSSSLEIAYEVVTNGRCIYAEDINKRLEYEAVVRGMYFDFKPFLNELRSQCIAQL